MYYDAWVPAGIRSIRRYVIVIDTKGYVREIHKVKGSRRKLRQRLRQDISDTIIVVPYSFKA